MGKDGQVETSSGIFSPLCCQITDVDQVSKASFPMKTISVAGFIKASTCKMDKDADKTKCNKTINIVSLFWFGFHVSYHQTKIQNVTLKL